MFLFFPVLACKVKFYHQNTLFVWQGMQYHFAATPKDKGCSVRLPIGQSTSVDLLFRWQILQLQPALVANNSCRFLCRAVDGAWCHHLLVLDAAVFL